MDKKTDLENPKKAVFRILPLFLMTIALSLTVVYLPQSKTASPAAAGAFLVFPFKLTFDKVNRQAEEQRVDLTVRNIQTGQERKYLDVLVLPDEQGIFSGSITLSGAASAEEFEFIVKGPKHLAKKFLGGEDFSLIPLLAGDLPNPNDKNHQDGVADSVDFSLVKSRLGQIDKKSLSIADVNFDLIIDQTDLDLVFEAVTGQLSDEK